MSVIYVRYESFVNFFKTRLNPTCLDLYLQLDPIDVDFNGLNLEIYSLLRLGKNETKTTTDDGKTSDQNENFNDEIIENRIKKCRPAEDNNNRSMMSNKLFPLDVSSLIKSDKIEEEKFFLNMQHHRDSVFSYIAGRNITCLWYKKHNRQWKWTCYDPFETTPPIWLNVSDLVVPTGSWKDEKPADSNQHFINWLNDLNPEIPIQTDDFCLEAFVKELKFDEAIFNLIDDFTKRVNMAPGLIINNHSSCKSVENINQTKTFTNKFSFCFDESLRFVAKTIVDLSVNFLDIHKIDINRDLNADSNQKFTITETTKYAINKKVKVKANKSLKINTYVKYVENFEVPFKASVVFKSKKKITGNSGEPVDSSISQIFLTENKFKGDLVEINDYEVIATINGSLLANCGMDSVFECKEL